MYGKDAQMKNEQDLAFDIGLAVDRSRDDADIHTKQREQETVAMAEIIARSKSTARRDRVMRWTTMLDIEPEQSCTDRCTTIDIRFPDGQRRRRRFLASAATTQLLAFVGASGLVPLDIFDTDQWGVFTTHPRVLLQGSVAARSLFDNRLFPRALVHVGELPLLEFGHGSSVARDTQMSSVEGSSSQDAMELD